MVLICMLSVVSCCKLDTRRLTTFPPMGDIVEYTREPVISYDQGQGTYLVTKEAVHNFIQYKLYVDEVNKWKTKNGVE